jgi:putative spermidine/putrescine transport system permease protein
MTRRWTVLPYLLLAPALLWLVVFFVVPLGQMFLLSFQQDPQSLTEPAFGLQNYERFLTDDYFRQPLLNSLVLGLIVTVLSLLLGYPAAHKLSRMTGRVKAMFYMLTVLPLVTGVVVRTFGWYILLGESGIVNGLLTGIGLTRGPIQFLFTPLAVVIALTEVLLPFMILSIHAALEAIDPRVEEAASSLGAPGHQVMLRITMPLSRPGVATGSILVFVLAVSSFVTPALLGGVRYRLLPTEVYNQALVLFNWPFASAIAFTLLAALAVGVVLLLRATSTRGAR